MDWIELRKQHTLTRIQIYSRWVGVETKKQQKESTYKF